MSIPSLRSTSIKDLVYIFLVLARKSMYFDSEKNSKGRSNTIRFGEYLCILDMHCFKSMAKIQKKSQWFCETSESKPCISKAKNGCSISSLSKIFHTCSKARSRRQRLPESCHKKKGPPAILPVPVVVHGTELKHLMIQFAQLNTMDDL